LGFNTTRSPGRTNVSQVTPIDSKAFRTDARANASS